MNERTPLGVGGMQAIQSERDKNRRLRAKLQRLSHENLVLRLLIKRGLELSDAHLFADTPTTQLVNALEG